MNEETQTKSMAIVTEQARKSQTLQERSRNSHGIAGTTQKQHTKLNMSRYKGPDFFTNDLSINFYTMK